MSEVRDLILPLLQKMQADAAAHRGRTDAIGEDIKAIKDKIESLEGLITWNLGLTSESRHAIETLQNKVKELEKRIAGLESRS